MTAASTRTTIARIPPNLLNGVILIVMFLCMFGSYYRWGWAFVAGAAALALTRPWLPTTTGPVRFAG
jgi:hypothetical protein